MIAPTLSEIASVFTRYGSFTFGGGTPTAVVLETEIVERRGWLDRSRLRIAYAFSRFTPGTNLLAFCTAAGWSLRGWPGAFVALIAASIPCSILVVLLTQLYSTWANNAIATIAFQGMMAAAVGIIGATCWQLVRPHIGSGTWLRTGVIVIGSLVLSSLAVPPIRVLLLAGIVGSFWREKSKP